LATCNKKIPKTPGLVDLIVIKDSENFSSQDKQAYEQILEESGVHLNEDGIKKHSSSYKYKNVIADMFGDKAFQWFGEGLLP